MCKLSRQVFHHSRQEEKQLGLVFVFHHDDAQVNLPGVADSHTQLVEVNLGVEVVEETVLHEDSLVGTEGPGDFIPGPPVLLVDAVETLDKGADVFRVFIFGRLIGWLEGSHISKYRALHLTGSVRLITDLQT